MSLKLILAIYQLCTFDIDPRFDKKICEEKMIECTMHDTFDNCADFYDY